MPKTSTILHTAAAVLLATAFALSEARAEDNNQHDVEALLASRASASCEHMLDLFLRSPVGVKDTSVRRHLTACYIAEARLVALGKAKPEIMDGTALPELPSRLLADHTRMLLDPYYPLAGKRLSLPVTSKPETNR